MGKHERGFARAERDLYPTPPWVIQALAEYVDLRDRNIWECAAGDGRMVRALEAQGVANVFASDIEPYPGLDCIFDFLAPGLPPGLIHFDGIITNSAWGVGNRTAVAFVEAGLERIAALGGFFCLLLPSDFDAAVSRSHLFQVHPFYAARIVLLDRPVWFERTDGKPAQPKENVVWQIWARPVLRFPGPAIVRHARTRRPRDPNAMNPR
jgi:hypothetical protein